MDGLSALLSIARQNMEVQVLHKADAGSELWLSWLPAAGIVLPADT